MATFNFKAQFVEEILAGKKSRTIRPGTVRNGVHLGSNISLYTGMRTKSCSLIAFARITGMLGIQILESGRMVYGEEIGHAPTSTDDKNFFQLDGFENREAFMEFFSSMHKLPFKGTMYCWELIDAPVPNIEPNILPAA